MNEGKNPPFDELEPTDYGDWIKSIKGNPNYIVRQSEYFDSSHNYMPKHRGGVPSLIGLTNPGETDIPPETIEELKETRALVKDLSNYGIETSFVGYVIGYTDEQVPNIFTVTEKVHGQDFGSGSEKITCKFSPELVENVSDSEFKQIENLLVSLFRYFQDKILTRGKALYDICRPEQYILGTTKSHPDQKQPYLVDIDPFSVRFTSQEESSSFNTVWGALKQFHSLIVRQFSIRSPKIAAAIREFHLRVVEPNLESDDPMLKSIANSTCDFTYYYKETDTSRPELCLDLINELHSLKIQNASAIPVLVDITQFILRNELLVSPKIMRRARAFVENYREDSPPGLEESEEFKTALTDGLNEQI